MMRKLSKSISPHFYITDIRNHGERSRVTGIFIFTLIKQEASRLFSSERSDCPG